MEQMKRERRFTCVLPVIMTKMVMIMMMAILFGDYNPQGSKNPNNGVLGPKCNLY